MEYIKNSVDLRNKKTLAVIIGALLLFIAIPLTVIGTLQFKEGIQHLKTRAAVPPIESMPFPRVLNFRYLTNSGILPDDSELAKFTGMVVDGGVDGSIAKALEFKKLHDEKLVLLYFWSTSRNKIINNPQQYYFSPKINNSNGTPQIWPGYWLLMNCAKLTDNLAPSNANPPISTISVSRCDSQDQPLPFDVGDNAMIWEPVGGDAYGKVEYIAITAVCDSRTTTCIPQNTVTVKRKAWGENATQQTFSASSGSSGAKIATIADTGGGGGSGFGYNHSDMAPVNPNNGMQANEWLADWLVTNFPKASDGTTLDGYQFDSANWFPPVAGENGDVKNLDCNDDGVIDYCSYEKNPGHPNTRTNSYGVGYQKFVNFVRTGLPDKLITADDGNRAVDDGNGSEFENFPNGDDYNQSSSALADLDFFMSSSFRQPRISYTYTKVPTEFYGGATGDNKKNRFGLVASLLCGAFHTYIAGYPDWNYYEWDEDGTINKTTTHLDPGYLGQIKGIAPNRIFRYADHVNKILNPDFEGNLDHWEIVNQAEYQASMTQDSSIAAPDNGHSSLRVDVSQIAPDAAASKYNRSSKLGVRLRYIGGLGINANPEYTAVFWAKSDAVREITVALRKSQSGSGDVPEAETFKIDSTWRRYYINLERNDLLDDHAILEFQIGSEIGQYWFDGVEFYQGTAEILTREFDNGLAVLNGSSVAQTFTPSDLSGAYKKINGFQDPAVNDGRVITDADPLVLGPKDGIILLKVTSPPKIGDIEPIPGDGDVDIHDLSTLISNWGPTSVAANKNADLNNDGSINVFDLSILLTNWGP